MDRKKILMVVLVVCAFLFFFPWLKSLGKAPEPRAQLPQLPSQPIAPAVEYADVLIAASDISYGTRLNESHFSWKQWPADAVSPNHITRDVKPRAIEEFANGVAKSEFYAEDPIVSRKIIMPGEKSVMAALLNPGMRAVTTRISVDTAAGGFIKPGDNVDIILTQSIQNSQGGGNSKRYVSQTIFENVRVMAIDQNFDPDGDATVIGSTATFEMTQEDSELLNQSVAQGDLSLTLRPLGRGSVPGRSHAKVTRSTNEVTHMTIYRDGQPSQVAIRGQ